ncbi:MAG: hypothetical protein U9Q79_06090 [Candidatus Hydrogenedentes bacterium]|nr:hypothetical protein [Candidatus Hydrogenedentota bacterium]
MKRNAGHGQTQTNTDGIQGGVLDYVTVRLWSAKPHYLALTATLSGGAEDFREQGAA